MHNTLTQPLKSIHVFLDRIIDYAGIFPPANLPLKKAFNSFLDYLKSPNNWMLGKFICTAKLLPELGNLIGESKEKQPIHISVIASEDDVDINSIRDFMSKNKRRVKVETIELRVPVHINDLGEFLKMLSKKTNKILPDIRNLFCEIPSNYNLAEAIKLLSSISADTPQVGFKLRTGGTEESAFPSPEQIANIIKSCRDNNVKMKCTAGLHHPIRHFSQEVTTKMHGFLNVFATGILACTRDLTKEQLFDILNDESSNNFNFSETAFLWKNHTASIEEISEARKNFIISFGSCSFEEPVNDLKNLGLL